MEQQNDEFSVIERFFCPLVAKNGPAFGLKDDAASFSLKGDEELVISKDMIVEDVHFFRRDGAKKIAAKLLLSNLSDLAASGARPLYYMLGFSKSDEVFLREFCDSLKEIQAKFDLSLIGGDTVKTTEKLFFCLTIFGVRKKGKNLARKNAKDGDLIFVSGVIGDAYLGFLLNSGRFDGEIDEKWREFYLNRYFYPFPRIELGRKLLEGDLSRCAIDVSDGFLADLRHICQASNLDADIFAQNIPFSDFANRNLDFQDLVSGGEDYELIFTVKKEDEERILELAKKLKISLTCVGVFKKTQTVPKITIFDDNNNEIEIEKYGYRH